MMNPMNPAPYFPDYPALLVVVYTSYMIFSVIAYLLIIWGLNDLKEEVKRLRKGDRKD